MTAKKKTVAPEPEPLRVLTAFTVVVDLEGRVSVIPDTGVPTVSDHVATLIDVETYCSQLSREAGRLMLIRELTPPPAPTAAERVAEALRQRSE